ncbi:ParE family toxin-like protein [Spirosoma arcticum]
MTHRTFERFWKRHDQLPDSVRELAKKNYELLKQDPLHPSLHFKKVGRKSQFWSVRVGEHYRAVAIEPEEGVVAWFWIGHHSEYDRIINQ